MKKIKFKKSARALVVVAHPDDETIWMGGTIMKYPDWDWTIFSLCRGDDKDRGPKFRRVAEFYHARPVITDLEDEGMMGITVSVPKIEALITRRLKQRQFDYIFTHGDNGEYGHPRHKGVNRAVKKLLKQGALGAQMILYFNYIKRYNREFSPLKLADKTDLTVKLTTKEFRKKKTVMTGIYGFDPGGIDANLCTNPEGFKVKILNN